jgi:hypothetical protein
MHAVHAAEATAQLQSQGMTAVERYWRAAQEGSNLGYMTVSYT